MPQGLRDTNVWYADVDPMSVVDHSLVDYVHANSGKRLLDLGCGVGGYSKRLQELGHEVCAFDVNAQYVEIARTLGVDAHTFDGGLIPLPDESVDTVFMIEVLEHITPPNLIIAEAFRVAKRNVIITVPNNSQKFSAAVEWDHMLETDHKNFFTVDSLGDLLRSQFPSVDITQVKPIDRALASDLLPPWGFLVYRAARKIGLVSDRHFFRLVASASK